ncbi:glutathione S-transferase [Sphingorhabdus sp. Alg239-R122]|uniref:glutathione S-transferase n=1 Tax=Sphingorhabdus sp. Alg239-R122 TaxID=2305989 RepID=UPI0013DBEC3B|nr:glutathione S-transferase [Sphingorhabdus sp. Alg239-R122]
MSETAPDTLPILYSFRRCPYAMRARMGLLASGTRVELREVLLRDKPQAMLDISPKGTVPVLQLQDGTVLGESIDIMRWALERHDPQGWLRHRQAACTIIEQIDGPFKHHLDRYKYHTRYENADPEFHRAEALGILQRLNMRLSEHGQLLGSQPTISDYASFPFIRQLANHDRSWFDALPLEALQKWLAGHLASDTFKTIMHKYGQWHAGAAPVTFPAITA